MITDISYLPYILEISCIIIILFSNAWIHIAVQGHIYLVACPLCHLISMQANSTMARRKAKFNASVKFIMLYYSGVVPFSEGPLSEVPL